MADIYGAGGVPRYNQGLGPRLRQGAQRQTRPIMGPQDVASAARPQATPQAGGVPGGMFSTIGGLVPNMGAMMQPRQASAATPPAVPPQPSSPFQFSIDPNMAISPETEQDAAMQQQLGRADGMAQMRAQGGIPFSERFPGMLPSEAIGGGNQYGLGSPGFSRAGMMGPLGHGFAPSSGVDFTPGGQYVPNPSPGRWGGPAPAAPESAPHLDTPDGRRARAGAEARQRISDFARLRQENPEEAERQVAARAEAGDDAMARTWADTGRMATMDPMARSIFNQMAGNDPDAIPTATGSQMPMLREAMRGARRAEQRTRRENRQERAAQRADQRSLRLGNRQPTLEEQAQAGNQGAIMQLGQQAQDQLAMQQMMMLEGQDQRGMQAGLMSDFMRMLSQNPNLTADQIQMMMQQPPEMFQHFGIGIPKPGMDQQQESPQTMQLEPPGTPGGLLGTLALDVAAPLAAGGAGWPQMGANLGQNFMRRMRRPAVQPEVQ